MFINLQKNVEISVKCLLQNTYKYQKTTTTPVLSCDDFFIK